MMTTQPMEQLRALLQLLALPVTGQVRLLPEDCGRMEQLASRLGEWRRRLPVELSAALSPGQAELLLQLERQLAHTCAERTSPVWTDTTMRRSAGLRKTRRLARAALLSFGWSLVLSGQGFSQHCREAGLVRGAIGVTTLPGGIPKGDRNGYRPKVLRDMYAVSKEHSTAF